MREPGAGIVIAVATYRRPDLLAELLRSIEQCVPVEGTRVVVVDNDASGSAEAVVQNSSLPVTYVIERVPGIAAARNRALDELNADDNAIVFVDDDERVHPSWLVELVQGWNKYSVEIVTGPVISVFDEHAPEWIVRGGFIQRDRQRSGTLLQSAATNNTLLSVSWWRQAGAPRFDDAFSESGGSDTEFFGRLVTRGARIAWVDEAIVEEDVPATRATFKWIWRRALRGGSVQARIRLRSGSRTKVAARALVSLPARAVGLVAGVVVHRRLRAQDLVPLAWQCGIASAVFGKTVREYIRD